MLDRVRLIASISDQELKDTEPELCMSVAHCRQALAAKPMTLEEQRNLERSMISGDESVVARLEEAGLFDWQKRQRRELDRQGEE